jgi:hypothetical protein
MLELIGTGNAGLQAQGYLVATIMAVTLIWALAPAILKRTQVHAPSEPRP